MEPLRHSNLREQALAVLKLRLISGDLAPGEIYSAAALAVELGVSNSPVREAMLTLVNQGLMETVRNRGFRVIPLSDKERMNAYDLRILLEIPSMVRLGKNSGVREQRDRFAAVAEEIVIAARSGDIVGYLDADHRFHLGLLGLLDNDQLNTIVSNLREQTRHYGLRALSARGELVKSAEEHRPILDAILADDVPRITRLMTDHLAHICGDWAG